MANPIPKFPEPIYGHKRHLGMGPIDPIDRECSRELSLSDLVDFGNQELVRLPTMLLVSLKALRATHTSSGRAVVVIGQEGTQKTLDITLRIRPHTFKDLEEMDAIYEQLEGATSSKYLVRAYLIEQNAPRYRVVPYDESEIVELDDLPADTRPDEDEAWLLISPQDLFWRNAEQSERLLTEWQERYQIKGLSQLQVLHHPSDDDALAPSGIELPSFPTREQVQDIVDQLTETLGVKLTVALTQRDYVASIKRYGVSLYEDTRSMARRMRKKAE
ncbi:hypothetical protein [Deinococcus ruber]|uniref:Uncharacterized protein n=1 Tax=Deinococcus ruber TaxID=1848197 RepID=A0A918F8M4_9DEIO|nr:hypothetical protein [Deinococcus ruber]GGR11640.1 hypothetical protein GCM10008957_25800 [Deinococcus ruber]